LAGVIVLSTTLEFQSRERIIFSAKKIGAFKKPVTLTKFGSDFGPQYDAYEQLISVDSLYQDWKKPFLKDFDELAKRGF
jgi:hypothetical protein